MQSQQRLLAVLAHPDDESFLCGETIAKMSERGVQITLLCATKGEMGRRMGKSHCNNKGGIARTKGGGVKKSL
ncbi:PIG-L family deacetylase [Peribacillus frigoritolerans]|nr:PIG-L family deacetylase [Peribacillus frigoritolerans]